MRLWIVGETGAWPLNGLTKNLMTMSPSLLGLYGINLRHTGAFSVLLI